MSLIVGARLKSIKDKLPTNATTSVKVNEIKYEFTDNNNFDRYPSFYKPNLLQKNLNFIPLKVDWWVINTSISSLSWYQVSIWPLPKLYLIWRDYTDSKSIAFACRRKENVLRPVRLQGDCGACYAYSVIEMIEANLAIHKNTTKTLSTQQMIDCAENGNNGCDGGDSCLLLEWLVNEKVKIRTDKEYPRSGDGMNQTCHVLLDDPATGMEVFQVNDFTCNR